MTDNNNNSNIEDNSSSNNNNNNTQLLKTIIINSWRQRLSPIEWSLKLYDSYYSSNNNINNNSSTNEINPIELCEILLDLMNVGQSPSPLLVSYLRYAISIKLIGYNEFFESVYKFSTISRAQHFSIILDILFDVINIINFPSHHNNNSNNNSNNSNNKISKRNHHSKIISTPISNVNLKVIKNIIAEPKLQSATGELNNNNIYTTTTTTTTTTTASSSPTSAIENKNGANGTNGIEDHHHNNHTGENGKSAPQMNGIHPTATTTSETSNSHKRKEMDNIEEQETISNKKMKHTGTEETQQLTATEQQQQQDIDQNHIENKQTHQQHTQPSPKQQQNELQQKPSQQQTSKKNYHRQLLSFTKLATILFKAIEYYFQEDDRINNINNSTTTQSSNTIIPTSPDQTPSNTNNSTQSSSYNNNSNNTTTPSSLNSNNTHLLYKNSVKSLEILSIIQNNSTFKTFIYLAKFEFTLTLFKDLVQPFLTIQNSIRDNINKQYNCSPSTQLISSQAKGQEFAHQQSQLLNPLFQLIKQKYQGLFIDFRKILINRQEILPLDDISSLAHGSSQTDKQLILSFEFIIEQEINGNHFKSSETKLINNNSYNKEKDEGINVTGINNSEDSSSTGLNGQQSQIKDDEEIEEEEEPNQTQQPQPQQQQMPLNNQQQHPPQIQKQLQSIKQANNVENISDCFSKLLTLKTVKGLNDIEFFLEIVKILFQKLVKSDPNSNEFKKTKLFLLFKIPQFYSLMINNGSGSGNNNSNNTKNNKSNNSNNNNSNNVNNSSKSSKKNKNVNFQGNIIENVLYQINQFPILSQVEENIILSLIQILIKKHLADINLLKSLFPVYHTDIDSIDSEIQSPPSSELSFDNLFDIHSIADIVKIKELIESLLNSSDPSNVSLMKRLFDFIKNHLINPFDYQDKLLSVLFNILENIDYNSNKLLITVIMYIFSDPLVIDCLDVHGYTLRLVMILIDACELYGCSSTTNSASSSTVDINGFTNEGDHDHNQKHLYFYFTIPFNLLYTLLIILYDVKNNKYNLDLIKSKLTESLNKKNSSGSKNFIQWIYNMIRDTNFNGSKDSTFEYQFLKNLFESSFSDDSIEKFQNYSQREFSSWDIVSKLPNIIFNIFDCYDKNIIQDEKLTQSISLLFQYIPFSPIIVFDYLSKTKSTLFNSISPSTTTSTFTSTSTSTSLPKNNGDLKLNGKQSSVNNKSNSSIKKEKSLGLVESCFWGLNENRLLFRLSDYHKSLISEENSNDLYKLFEPIFETTSLTLFPKLQKFSEFRYYSHQSTIFNSICSIYQTPPIQLFNMTPSIAIHQIIDQFLTKTVSPNLANLERDIRYIYMRLSNDIFQIVNLVAQEILDIILLSCQVESLYSIRAMELGGYILGGLIGIESLPILLNSIVPSWSEHIQTSLHGQLLSYFCFSAIVHSNSLYYIQNDICIQNTFKKFFLLLNDTMKRMLSVAPLNGLVAYCLSTITLLIHLNHSSNTSSNIQLVNQLYEIISKNQLKKKKKLLKQQKKLLQQKDQQQQSQNGDETNVKTTQQTQQHVNKEPNYEKLEESIKFKNSCSNNQPKLKSIFNILSISQLEDMSMSILNLSNFFLAISIFDKNDLQNCSKLFNP